MQPDLELRELIATKLMGVRLVHRWGLRCGKKEAKTDLFVGGKGLRHHGFLGHLGLSEIRSVLPAYELDLAAAFQAVEKMRARPNKQSKDGWHWRICSPFQTGDDWFAGLTPSGVTGWNGRPDIEAHHEHLPRAIALAIRAALQSEES